MAKKKLYVCGRCGYRSSHKAMCHSCGFMLEEECGKCYSAKGNCVCKLHGVFIGARHEKKPKKTAAAKKKPKRKKKRKQKRERRGR